MLVDSKRELGAVLRVSRRRLGLTQADVAERAGVQRTWLVRLEAGRENPTFDKLLSVFRALGVGMDLEPRDTEQRNRPAANVPSLLDQHLRNFDARHAGVLPGLADATTLRRDDS